MAIRSTEVRVVVVMALFALGLVLGRVVAAGLERLAAELERPHPGWEAPATPLTPQLDPEFVALG
jgi:hypothetical protein